MHHPYISSGGKSPLPLSIIHAQAGMRINRVLLVLAETAIHFTHMKPSRHLWSDIMNRRMEAVGCHVFLVAGVATFAIILLWKVTWSIE
jgi:hypothetical protein